MEVSVVARYGKEAPGKARGVADLRQRTVEALSYGGELFQRFGFEYAYEVIGGFGRVYLYVAEKL